MSWSAKIVQILKESKKIKNVAVFDLEGQLLSHFGELLELTPKEIGTLYKCFPRTSSHPVSSVTMDGTTYRLLQVRSDTLIAVHESDLLVCYLLAHGLILAQGSSQDPGSCIYAVTSAWDQVELLHGLLY
uniref:Profilin n=1 Tax=Octopus bimaculoides TaxID=37653 RepID=A0A0L8FYA1_OCTBM